MFNYNLLYFLIFSVVCSYCGEDFAVLGRLQWRCKKRMPSSSGPNKSFNIVVDSTKSPISITNVVTCCCGKACKGTKGLKMHQRRCRTMEGLSEATQTVMSNSNSDAQSSLDNNKESNQSLLCVDKKRGFICRSQRINGRWPTIASKQSLPTSILNLIRLTLMTPSGI